MVTECILTDDILEHCPDRELELLTKMPRCRFSRFSWTSLLFNLINFPWPQSLYCLPLNVKQGKLCLTSKLNLLCVTRHSHLERKWWLSVCVQVLSNRHRAFLASPGRSNMRIPKVLWLAYLPIPTAPYIGTVEILKAAHGCYGVYQDYL